MKGLKQLGLFVVGGAVGLVAGIALTMSGPKASAAENESHNLLLHAGHVATCVAEGEKDYWECTDCGKYFGDANGYNEIAADELDTWKVAEKLEHASSRAYYHPAKVATCAEKGNVAYYFCINGCGGYFADEACSGDALNESKVFTPQKSHGIGQWVEYQAATCLADGHAAHYECPNCHQAFADKTCKVAMFDVVIKGGHRTDDDHYVAWQDATCETAGHEDYYTCANGCGSLFRDDACQNQLNQVTVIPAMGHKSFASYYHAYQAPDCEHDGNVEYWACENGCGKKFAEEACRHEITNDVLPATGHQWVLDFNVKNRTLAASRAVVNGDLVENRVVKYQQSCAHCGKAHVENGYTAEEKGSGFAELASAKVKSEITWDEDGVVYDLFTLDESNFVNGVAKIQIYLPWNYHNGSQAKLNDQAIDWAGLVTSKSKMTLTVSLEDVQTGMVWEFDWDGDGTYEQMIKIQLA